MRSSWLALAGPSRIPPAAPDCSPAANPKGDAVDRHRPPHRSTRRRRRPRPGAHGKPGPGDPTRVRRLSSPGRKQKHSRHDSAWRGRQHAPSCLVDALETQQFGIRPMDEYHRITGACPRANPDRACGGRAGPGKPMAQHPVRAIGTASPNASRGGRLPGAAWRQRHLAAHAKRCLAAARSQPVGSDAVVPGGQRWAVRPGGRTQRGCRVAGGDRAAARHGRIPARAHADPSTAALATKWKGDLISATLDNDP